MSELYANKVCLAPMVRAGTLPLRLLSLRYGADLVYTEEIIDKRIIYSTRVVNDVVGCVDFISNNGESVVLRTSPEEAGKVVFQVGTADAVHALQAAQQVARDVAAVDINMGCPKHFSVHGGMGAALLRKPEVACDIIKTLRRNLNIPISCKIRLLEDTKATIEVAKRLEQAGAVAIGLHARQKHERPVDKAHWDQFAPVAAALSVPILANGDIFVREDLDKLREQSGISSFLIARGALANPSIFRREGMLPAQDVVVDYLKVSAETDNVFQNTKYTVSRMIPCKTDADASCAVTVAELYSIKDGAQMYALWDLQNFYKQHQDAFRAKAAALQVNREGVNAPPLQSEQLPASLMEMEASDAPKKQFYCDVCKLQLLSDQDIALHSKGKKHKKTVRRMKAATFSEYISRAAALQPEAIPVSDDGVKRKEEEEEETANTTGQEHENPAGDDRAPKRAKVE